MSSVLVGFDQHSDTIWGRKKKKRMVIQHNRISSNLLETFKKKHFPEKVKTKSNVWGKLNFFSSLSFSSCQICFHRISSA